METMKALRQVIFITLGVVVTALMLTTVSHGTGDDCEKPEWTLVAGPGEQPVVRKIRGAAVTRDTITLEADYSLVMKDGGRVTIVAKDKKESGDLACICTKASQGAKNPSCGLTLGKVTKSGYGMSHVAFTCNPKQCQQCGRSLVTPDGAQVLL